MELDKHEDSKPNKGGNPNWKPGQSGNPKGRPKKDISITSLVRELLEKEGAKGKTNAQLVAEAIIKLATSPNARGHVPTVQELINRLEGKVADIHKIEGEILITPNMRAIAAREMLDTKEEETKLLGVNTTE